MRTTPPLPAPPPPAEPGEGVEVRVASALPVTEGVGLEVGQKLGVGEGVVVLEDVAVADGVGELVAEGGGAGLQEAEPRVDTCPCGQARQAASEVWPASALKVDDGQATTELSVQGQ